MGIDRVVDRFDAEEIQAHGAVQQEVRATAGAALQFIPQVRLLDQAIAIPATEAIVHQCVGQRPGLLEIPLARNGTQLRWQLAGIAFPDFARPGLQARAGLSLIHI